MQKHNTKQVRPVMPVCLINVGRLFILESIIILVGFFATCTYDLCKQHKKRTNRVRTGIIYCDVVVYRLLIFTEYYFFNITRYCGMVVYIPLPAYTGKVQTLLVTVF